MTDLERKAKNLEKGLSFLLWTLQPEHHEKEGINPKTGKKDVKMWGRDGNGVGYSYWKGERNSARG